MADAKVSALIRRINELVEADTGSRSLAVGDQITRRVTRSDQRRLRLLADNLDIPARLAPRPGEPDPRVAVRAALVETVAGCVGVLEPREPTDESLYPYGRARFETAMSRLHALYETPRLLAELRPGGRAEDLGIFPTPKLEGDLLAAHAAVVAISARTGRPAGTIRHEIVAAGHGAHATTAARLLLQSRPDFAVLPAADRNTLTTSIADELESRFENHERQRPGPEIGAVLADRQQVARFGSSAITSASETAREELDHLHRSFDELGWPPAVERPESVYQLCEQIQGAVGELTDTPNSRWDGGLEPDLGQAPDTTLRLTEGQAAALGKLLESNSTYPLSAEDAADAREAVQVVAAAYARWAVPEEYDARHEAAADSVAPRFATIEQAVGTAYAEDHLREIADRALPYELATQVRQAQPPLPDQRLAPAARAFAAVVDDVAGLEEGETLRRMAGEGRVLMTQAAADELVEAVGVPNIERPYAGRMITDEADRRFEALPTELGTERDAARQYGVETGKAAVMMAESYAEEPGLAQRESLMADREVAAPMARFASGHDPALTRPRAQPRDSAPTANRTTSGPDQNRPTLGR